MPASHPRLLLVSLWFAILSSPSFAEIYRCQTKEGRVIYSDAHCNERGNSGVESKVEIDPKLNVADSVRVPVKAAPPPKKSNNPYYNGGQPPQFPVYYNPKDAPQQMGIDEMSSLIRAALRTWEYDCPLRFSFVGISHASQLPLGEGILIRWDKSLIGKPHPANADTGVAGQGQFARSVHLQPAAYSPLHWRSILLHELGHVIGLPHQHQDSGSIMSYARERNLEINNLSRNDYRACKFAMRDRFGVELRYENLHGDTPLEQKVSDVEFYARQKKESQVSKEERGRVTLIGR